MKKAYPNYNDYIPTQPSYDIGKWMAAMKSIYIKLHLGIDKDASVNEITTDWNKIEKNHFIDWLKFYEAGDHLKYKMAQHSYYVNDNIPNYFIPNPKGKAPSPILNVNEAIDQVPEQAEVESKKSPEVSEEEKRKAIEEQRKKILGRLNSAEKLLGSHQGQLFAGPEFEKLLSAIYELKKQIQTVNKISSTNRTYVDLIIRQANILFHQGFEKSSNFLYKFAQNTPGNFDVNQGPIPAGGSALDGAGALQNPTPDLTAPLPDLDKKEKDGIGGFLDNMEDSGLTEVEDIDSNKVEDEVSVDDDVLLNQEILPEDDKDLVVKAQALPADPATPAPAPTEVESPPPADAAPTQGLTEEDIKKDPEVEQASSDFDALIDSAFANLTVADIVRKLESINKIFRNREISRQLAIVDVMLDRLGLAPYFPTLAEATNKQLEANQYCLTRIEDILSKLRGTIQTSDVDLAGESTPPNPEAAKMKQNLEVADDKERQRKELRKNLQDQEVLDKSKAPLEVENVPEDLANQPAQVEAPPTKPAQPAPVG